MPTQLITRRKRESHPGTPVVWATARGRELTTAMAAAHQPQLSIAAALGIPGSTFREMLKRDDKLRLAYEAGKAISENNLVQQLVETAQGNGKMSAASAMFLLKTLHGYRETGPATAEDTTPVTLNLNLGVEPLSPEAYAKKHKVIDHD